MLDLILHLIATLLAGLPWVLPMFFWGGCPCCSPCDAACQSSGRPTQFQIDVAGMTNGTCSNCASFDGTWVGSATPATSPFYDGCTWDDLGGPCHFVPAVIIHLLDNAGNVSCRVSVGATTGADAVLFYEDNIGLSSPGDCSTISGVNVPFLSNGTSCQGSAATCTVTAL